MAGFILSYRSGSVTLTSRFGWRILFKGTPNEVEGYHKGVDLVGTDKTLVAPCDGVVKSSTIITDKSNLTWEWGNYIRIDRADGVQIFMCHMAERKVKVGQSVKAGDVVGIEGNTGYSFGSHCHFEVRKNGTSVDPTPYLGIANAAGTYPVKTSAPVVRKSSYTANGLMFERIDNFSIKYWDKPKKQIPNNSSTGGFWAAYSMIMLHCSIRM